MSDVIVAVLLGALQGVLEWLPVSSEGGVAVARTLAAGADPATATRLALFLHGGTALSAAAYYRADLYDLATAVSAAGGWPADEAGADLTFLAVATVASGVVGLPAYLLLEAAVSALTGGVFVALVGGLLVVTGLLQRFAGRVTLPERATPDVVDALLVGALQGVAILPGVSRSGTTVSALLLRGHDGEPSFRLSFLLAIPASLGAGVLAALDGGLATLSPVAAGIALATAAVVGYATVGTLVALVRRVPFWGVCVGFGGLGVVAGALLAV